MDAALSLIQSLGINSTVWTQLVVFLFTFVILNQLVFKPYFQAHYERHARTEGGKEDTSNIMKESQTLQVEYERRARELNDKVRLAFEKAKTDALTEQNTILARAREQAVHQVKISRERLEKELDQARQQLSQEVREIGVIIANKLIGIEGSPTGNGKEAHQ